MRWTISAVRWTISPVILVSLIATGAMAQQQPLRRYKPATISYDVKGADDPALVALLDELRAAVNKRDVAAIRNAASPRMTIVKPLIGFPPASAPKPVKLDDKLAGPERLDQAITLLSTADDSPDRKTLDGLMLMALGEALSKGTVSRSTLVRGAFCAPAEPRFDRGQVLAIARAAGELPDNLVILGEDTAFLEKPDPAAPEIATLKAGSVVPFTEGAVEGADHKRNWYAVALPSGKRGYARDDRSIAFEATRFCFTKDGKGDEAKWSLSTVIVPSL